MEKGWKNLTSSGRSANRRGKPLSNTFSVDDTLDSGLVDGRPDVDLYSTSPIVNAHSPLDSDDDTAFSDTVLYPSAHRIFGQPPAHFGDQHYQPIPSIQHLLDSTSGRNSNAEESVQ